MPNEAERWLRNEIDQNDNDFAEPMQRRASVFNAWAERSRSPLLAHGVPILAILTDARFMPRKMQFLQQHITNANCALAEHQAV